MEEGETDDLTAPDVLEAWEGFKEFGETVFFFSDCLAVDFRTLTGLDFLEVDGLSEAVFFTPFACVFFTEPVGFFLILGFRVFFTDIATDFLADFLGDALATPKNLPRNL